MNELLTRIDDVLRHIEAHLTEPLSLDDLAARTGYSAFHFHRLATAMFGLPVGRYIRRRRLSVAAARLISTQDRILDIALDAQFESQEAFTRAFKEQHGMTPGRYRSRGVSTVTMQQPLPIDLLVARVNNTEAQVRLEALQPRIEDRPALTTIGMSIRIHGGDKDDPDAIPSLWGKFWCRIGEIAGADISKCYGICICEERLKRDGDSNGDDLPDQPAFVYVAAVATSEPDAPLPEGLERHDLTAGRYAMFTHSGHISGIRDAFNTIFGTWLPSSGHKLRETYEYEIYDQRFNPRTGEGVIDIALPIVD